MDKGCIQLYYGDGKGKTTAAIGQIVRCVGHGFKVLVYQFLKEPTSGEVSVIRSLPGVEYIPNEGPIPFMFNLTPEQQDIFDRAAEEAKDYQRQYSQDYNETALETMEAAGVEITEVDLDVWKEAVAPIYENAEQLNLNQELIDRILAD